MQLVAEAQDYAPAQDSVNFSGGFGCEPHAITGCADANTLSKATIELPARKGQAVHFAKPLFEFAGSSVRSGVATKCQRPDPREPLLRRFLSLLVPLILPQLPSLPQPLSPLPWLPQNAIHGPSRD